jgi:hypothetical protein
MHAPFVFSSVQPYLLVAIAALFYLAFTWQGAPPPLSCGARHTLAAVGGLLLSKHNGGGGATPTVSDGLFIYSLGGGVSLPSSGGQPLLQTFPAPRLLGRGHHSCLLWPACSFTVCVWGRASPPLSGAQDTLPSWLHVFFFQLLVYYSVFGFFFLFSLGGDQSVQGPMLICPREYHVPLICSPGGLPSRVGAGTWWHKSPLGFSV